MTVGPLPARQLFVVVGRDQARLRMRLLPVVDGGERPAAVNRGVGIAPLERLGPGDPDALTAVYHLFRRLPLPDAAPDAPETLAVAFAAWGEALARAGIDLRLERTALYGPPLPRSDWAAPPSGVSLRPWDIELTALAAGLRTVVKLDRLPAAVLAPLRDTVEQRGWPTEVVGAPSESATLFVGREAQALAEVRHLEELLLLGRDDADTAAAVRRMGALLGYPPCCADRFTRIVGQNDTTLAWTLLPGLPHPPAEPLTQWLQPGLALLSHAPCDLGCAASVALAAGLLEAIDRCDAGFAPRWRALAARVQVVDRHGDRFALAAEGPLDAGERVIAAEVLGAGGSGPDAAARARGLVGRVIRALLGGAAVDDDTWWAPYAADHRGAP